jgi:hypothetical protein
VTVAGLPVTVPVQVASETELNAYVVVTSGAGVMLRVAGEALMPL